MRTVTIGESNPILGIKNTLDIRSIKNYHISENSLSSGKIYLKGGLGTRAVLNLFDNEGNSDVLILTIALSIPNALNAAIKCSMVET